MEIAISAIAALGSTLATGATAATAAAIPASAAGASLAIEGLGAAAAAGGTGLSSILGGVGTAASILSGGTSVLSAMRTMAAGDAKGAEIEAQAMDDRMAGVQRRTRFKREALDILGQNDVAAAASGIDLAYGQAADQRARTWEDLTRESEIDRQQEEMRLMGYRRASRRARSSGQLSGFLQLGEGLASMAGSFG
ncbi:hypothetical protein KHC23_07765 [Ancylobacter dichloromethanicus]|uniref:Uncharacterized protein n=1 Tax=Ancylobacter dichloromethanicus TaxID=518825 RepID=A0A9W6J8B0_9HYPH|nr:hypothetical protein [Ancylobacter dichloromethanicus]MBS7553543.1 hypothetical protein [Ancylobacter dichloromethanicus]GLK72602.1 hypothetical protein GCM10017643_27180 [Ancylobacter dichloromethanicus]